MSAAKKSRGNGVNRNLNGNLESARNPRYSRQETLTDVGAHGQRLLQNARVLCVGAGGLGSPAAMYLASAGVGTVGLIDSDRVDLSNLQRQVLFTESDVGNSKVTAGAARLRAMNSQIKVVTHDEDLNAANALRIMSGYDVVLDGTDNFSTKFLINDACLKLGLPMVYGSISQFEGQVSVFWRGHGPCYRCLHPREPKAPIQNCAEAGVIGGVAGIVGSMMAVEAIKTILHAHDPSSKLKPLIGRLLVVDAGSGDILNVVIPKRAQCDCTRPPEEIRLSDESRMCASLGATSPGVSIAELKTVLASGAAMVIDVREESEWCSGHIAGTRFHSLSRLEADEIPEGVAKDASIIVICKMGQRSKRAQQILIANGFMNVRSVDGGIATWTEALISET
jgi:adenylyltransferase/sulfurtransferase